MIPLLAALAAGGCAALWAAPVGRAVPFDVRAAPGLHLSTGSRRGAGPLVAFVAVLPFAGVPAALLAALAAVLVPRARRRRLAAQAADRQRRAVPETLRALAAELAAGSDAAAALAAVAASLPPDDPLRADLDLAARPATDPHDALAGSTVPALRDLASCWAVSRTAGAPLADVTARLAAVADADAARHGELTAALAGPRASARLLAALPVAGVGLAALLGGSPVRFLLQTVPGGACLVGGVVLDLLGLAWTERLAARALR